MVSVDAKSSPRAGDKKEIFGIRTTELAQRGSLHTAREIAQQPRVWREAMDQVAETREQINAWLHPRLDQQRVQVLFCGAGTSAYVGDTLAAWLRRSFKSDHPISFAAISTTDLVADPAQYLSDDRPTIMISFARSGDSPESVASIELADQLLSECSHLILTCNPDGRLAAYANADPSVLCLYMPAGTNDHGFAMTSSYSSMLVSCATIFVPMPHQLEMSATLAERVISSMYGEIAEVARSSFDRLLVLGSGTLTGTAREAALKCLELAAGQRVAVSDTPLGVRHGPKIMISADTIVVQMVSADPYTSQYDRDLLDELKSDARASRIIELSPQALFAGEELALDDIWLSLVYIVYCQILAFLTSFDLGVEVDSPCLSGEVNRVVQGVTIYPYAEQDG